MPLNDKAIIEAMARILDHEIWEHDDSALLPGAIQFQRTMSYKRAKAAYTVAKRLICEQMAAEFRKGAHSPAMVSVILAIGRDEL